jgi:hypothetical protein
VRYVLYTDSMMNFWALGWDRARVNRAQFEGLDSRALNRFFKINSGQVDEHNDWSIYCDANADVVATQAQILNLINFLDANGFEMAAYTHPHRTSWKQELDEIEKKNKFSCARDYLSNIYRRYSEFGIPDRLWEGGVIFRKNTPKMSLAMRDWWVETEILGRDQVSLPLVIKKHNLKIYDLGLRENSSLFRFRSHLGSSVAGKSLEVIKQLPLFMQAFFSALRLP